MLVVETTMKRLLLLRHSKTVPSSPQGDFERELAPRGRKDAARMGEYMADAGLVPAATLVSPARRTRETAELAMAECASAPVLIFERGLYLAEAQDIITLIRNSDPDIPSLLVVGHNPGLAELANLLTVFGDPQARQQMQAKFPTSALAVIDLPCDVWQGVAFHSGHLDRYVTPKLLRHE